MKKKKTGVVNNTQLSFKHYDPDFSLLNIENHFEIDTQVTLYYGDRLELLEEIKNSGALAELIVTSPPYNVGKEYERQTSLEDYFDGQKQTIEACIEILSPTGSICWQVGHYIHGSGKNKEAYSLDLDLY